MRRGRVAVATAVAAAVTSCSAGPLRAGRRSDEQAAGAGDARPGRFFQVFDQHDVVAVTSVAHCGVAPPPAGRERLKVNAAGRETIGISPRRHIAMPAC